MTARILVAEDDPKQAELIRLYLAREGFTVMVVHNGRDAVDEARQRRPDLLVLDVMMPKVDGLDVCRILRADGDIPIVMLTSRSAEDDLLLGFDLGADDYMTKPYSPRELVARIRTVLRRCQAAASQKADSIHHVGDLQIDVVRHEARLADQLLDVTPAEFNILRCLAAQPGRAFTRQHLLEVAFGFDHYVLDRTIDVHMLNLRKKIEADPPNPRYLLTVYGVGYKMAEVEPGSLVSHADAP